MHYHYWRFTFFTFDGFYLAIRRWPTESVETVPNGILPDSLAKIIRESLVYYRLKTLTANIQSLGSFLEFSNDHRITMFVIFT